MPRPETFIIFSGTEMPKAETFIIFEGPEMNKSETVGTFVQKNCQIVSGPPLLVDA